MAKYAWLLACWFEVACANDLPDGAGNIYATDEDSVRDYLLLSLPDPPGNSGAVQVALTWSQTPSVLVPLWTLTFRRHRPLHPVGWIAPTEPVPGWAVMV
jgi:hypothetical protein